MGYNNDDKDRRENGPERRRSIFVEYLRTDDVRHALVYQLRKTRPGLVALMRKEVLHAGAQAVPHDLDANHHQDKSR